MAPKRMRAATLAAGLLAAIFVPGQATACPACREALAAAPETSGQAAVARSFNRSILAMAFMPFLLGGTTIYLLVRDQRPDPT